MKVVSLIFAVAGITLGILACWLLAASEATTVPAVFWPMVFGGGIFISAACVLSDRKRRVEE